MKGVYTIEKKLGETPLECLVRLRERESIPMAVPLAYAGRLDPMAEGTLLVLAGNACKDQRRYQKLDKEYEFEVLLGIETDTGDILGIPNLSAQKMPAVTELRKVLSGLQGMLELPYPRFSSKTVKGKPLFLWTLENRLHEIEIPVAKTNVYQLRFVEMHTIESTALLQYVSERIQLITPVTEPSKALGADFRRGTILPAWKQLLSENPHVTFTVLKLRAIVSSGTYIRSLTPEIARRLGGVGLAYSIKRTKIGRFTPLPFSLGFWRKRY